MSDEYFLISRKIENWKWWHNPTARSLWIYMLNEANYSDSYLKDGTLCKRGQYATSIRSMAEGSGLSCNTIRYWYKQFEKSGEISIFTTQHTTHHYRLITIVNYGKYQHDSDSNHTAYHTMTDTMTDTDINKVIKVNKVNKEKNKDIVHRFTRPTIQELQEYSSSISYERFDAEYFIDYYNSNGWKVGKNSMKDWKAAVRTWKRNDQKKSTKQNHSSLEDLPF